MDPRNNSTRAKVYDVLVIGAGAAGLSCAQELVDAGLNVAVIEARTRVGGRMHSLQSESSHLAIELGPEFVHSAAKVLLDKLKNFGQSFYGVTDNHHSFENGNLKYVPDFFEKISKLLTANRSPAAGSGDEAMQEFLDAQSSISKASKKLIQSFVEGFEAANLRSASRKDIETSMQTDDPSINGVETFRPTLGYGAFAKELAQNLRDEERVFLNLAVKKIEWARHSVKIECHAANSSRTVAFQARQAVITLPLGVLKSESDQKYAIRWQPEVPGLHSILEKIEMGHVQRLTFRFKERFWETLVSEPPLSYVHLGPEHYFPTWWNKMPIYSGDLVAWQGGPKAFEMSSWSRENKIKAALNSLSLWSGFAVSALSEKLISCHSHDWSADPLSRGAYSYVGVNGESAAKRFSKPIEDTLYFAGEATAQGSSRGTVHGAIESGLRAAKSILAVSTQARPKSKKSDRTNFKSKHLNPNQSLDSHSNLLSNRRRPHAKDKPQKQPTRASVSGAKAELAGPGIEDRTAPAV